MIRKDVAKVIGNGFGKGGEQISEMLAFGKKPTPRAVLVRNEPIKGGGDVIGNTKSQ